MIRRLVTAISVIHHWNHSRIRRTTATSARAYAVYRQTPGKSPRFAEPVGDHRQECNRNAEPVHYPMNGRDVPDLLTGLQDALNVAHGASRPLASPIGASALSTHHQRGFYLHRPTRPTPTRPTPTRRQRGQRHIHSHGANPHRGSRPGHRSRQAQNNRSSCSRNDEVSRVWRQPYIHTLNPILYPNKLRPGGLQGQQEALRPPRRRQLFVCASDRSFRIFPDVNKYELLDRKTLRGNHERSSDPPATLPGSAHPWPTARRRAAMVGGDKGT